MSDASVLFLFAETPVHAGAGGGKAAVDLPIQRSVQTQWPIVNDGTVRGGLRRLVTDPNAYFGTMEKPGNIVTPDAEVLLFPVASARGMTAWVTCITCLQYFLRRVAMFRDKLSQEAQERFTTLEKNLDQVSDTQTDVVLHTDAAITWAVGDKKAVVLESDRFDVVADEARQTAADEIVEWMATNVVPHKPATGQKTSFWATRMRSHLAIIPDEAFTHYVQHKTDIRTRVKIEEGRAAKSGPWTEENLPVDTIMHALMVDGHDPSAENPGGTLAMYRKEISLDTSFPVMQLGGDQNLGRGMFRLRELGV